MHSAYYIAKGQKTLGPCSKDDLRNFLAYGSIRDSDLVKREDEEQWRPVSTLLELHAEGQIVDPQRIDWESGGAFLTPAGWWHSHVNPSDQEARLLPVQDAGLHSHLRSLDIRFSG